MKHTITLAGIFFALFVAHSAYALTPTAALRVVPSGQAGDTLTVDIRLDTDGQAVGGIEAFVQYSENLEFVSSDDTDSVMDQEVIPVQAKGDDAMEFVRLRFDEGFSGEDGYIVGLTFRIVGTGETFIRIEAQGSQVIAFEDSSNILQSGHGIKANIPAIPDAGSDTIIATEEIPEGGAASMWESTVEEVVVREEAPSMDDEDAEEIMAMDMEDHEMDDMAHAAEETQMQYVVVSAILGLGVLLVAALLLFRKRGGKAGPPPVA